jgi:Zn/Cd-binding protein ZinT
MAVPIPPKIDDYWFDTNRINNGTYNRSLAPPSTPYNSACQSVRLDVYANDFNCHLAKATLSVSTIAVAHHGLDEEKYIKEKLAYELATHMIQNNLVSFTKLGNPHQNTSDYMARAVLMDKNGVDTIRKMVP